MSQRNLLVKLIACICGGVLLTAQANGLSTMASVELKPSDGHSQDGFGFSVGISGNVAIVGSWESNHLAGSAYLFNLAGQQLFKLVGNDTSGNDNFGISVAISGNLAVVGARGNDLHGSSAGAAYVFDVNTGQQLRRLEHSFLTAGDEFGFSSAMQGTTALIGAWQDIVTGSNSGAAYLFDASTGSLLYRLTPNDSAPAQWFGASVALSGTKAIVGAFGDPSGTRKGAAYIFDTATGNQLLKLTPSDGTSFDVFGTSVAIDGNLAVVGAPDHGHGGEAYVYNTQTGAELFRLTGTGVGTNNFGQSVAVRNGIIAVGDPDGGNLSSSGVVFLFDATTGNQLTWLTAPDASVGDQFGWSLALAPDSTNITGARYAGNSAAQTDIGAAYVFVPEPATAAMLMFASAVCGLVRRRTQ